jgi:hypothetical protein
MNITRRHSLATLAVLVAAAGVLPVDAIAGATLQGSQGHKHRRPPSDQISTVCVPGEPDFDPVQCHKDITSNAPKPNKSAARPADALALWNLRMILSENRFPLFGLVY